MNDNLRAAPARPLVSVIVPAYNAEAFIHQTLVSILAQTYQNIEVIVVDDGSRDRTNRIVKSVAKNDDRIVLLRQSNKGVAAARNLAIEKSSGEFIAPIDADDVWHPEKVEKQVRCMVQAGPEVGLTYTWWIRIDAEGFPIHTSPNWHVEGTVFESLLALNFIGNASVPLMRRACIESLGGYDTQLKQSGGQGCEDWELALRIADNYQLRVVPAYLVGYRSVTASMATDCSAMARSHESMIEKIKERHPEIPDSIYRLSKGHLCLYLAGVSYRGGRYGSALRWMHRACCSKQASVLSPWLLKLIAAGLPRLTAGLVTNRGRPNEHAWLSEPHVSYGRFCLIDMRGRVHSS